MRPDPQLSDFTPDESQGVANGGTDRAAGNKAPRKIATNTRGKPFQPGNPGKPKGARNRATKALETLLGNSAEDVAMAVIRAARNGDTAAARLVLERVLPARKDQPLEIDLPPISGAESLLAAGGTVLKAVAEGELTPAEGDGLMTLIERQRRLVEATELETRIAALEQEMRK